MLLEMFKYVLSMKSLIDGKMDKNMNILNRLNKIEGKVNLTTKAVIRHDTDIQNNAKRINQQELNNMKRNLIVTGIKEKKKVRIASNV